MQKNVHMSIYWQTATHIDQWSLILWHLLLFHRKWFQYSYTSAKTRDQDQDFTIENQDLSLKTETPERNLTNVHNDKYQNQLAISVNCRDRMQIKYKNRSKTSGQSQQVLKVSSIRFHTGMQPFTPLVNGLIDDWLLHPRPRCNQSVLQIINITYRDLWGRVGT